MTLSIKPRHKEEKKLLDKELVHRLNTDTVILIVLTSCIGVATAIIVSLMPGFTHPHLLEGASVVIYKHMGLIYSADKNAGYIDYVLTESDGSYSFDGLPSGVYRFTFTYSDRVVRIIDNYAVWPGSSSSYVFATE